MDNKRKLKLYPSQLKFLFSTKKEVLMSAGYGCVAGSTKLLTKEGEIEIETLVKENKAPIVLTFTGNDFKWIQAEVPYLKSNEEALKIATGDGHMIEVAANHYLLTSQGWKPASSCVVGEQLLGYSACPQESNSGIVHPVRQQGVSHSSHKAEDSQGDYPERRHLCDEQLPCLSNSAQDVFPLPSDVLGRNHLNLLKDVEVGKLKYNRPYQPFCLPSMQDLENPSCISNLQQHHSSLKTCEAFLRHPCATLIHNGQLSVLSSSHSYIEEDIRPYYCAKGICDSKDYTNRAFSDPVSYSYASPCLITSIIQEINHTHLTKIYDIGVPVYHNYVAHGLIHHNSGKSFALAIKVAIELTKPGNIVILSRKYFGDLKTSTLRSLIEGDGSQPPILKPGTYTYNVLDKRIDLYGGGTCFLIGFDNPQKVGSINAGFVGVDEAWEIDEAEYMSLLKRLRNDVGCRQIMMVTNPGTFGHFLYRKFYTDRKPEDDMEVIEASTLENVDLPKDYVEKFLLKQCTNQQDIDFTMNGKWIPCGTLVYPQWNRDKIVEKDVKGFQYFYIALDYGYSGRMALGLFGVDGDNNLHLIDEFYKTRALHIDVYDQLVKWQDYNAKMIVDPSAASFIAELEARGMDVEPAENAVDIGVGRMRNMLATNQFTIDPRCVNFVDEIENYSLDEKGKPIKMRDHLMDLTRYMCSYLNASSNNGVNIYSYTDWLEKEMKTLREKGDIEGLLALKGEDHVFN